MGSAQPEQGHKHCMNRFDGKRSIITDDSSVYPYDGHLGVREGFSEKSTKGFVHTSVYKIL